MTSPEKQAMTTLSTVIGLLERATEGDVHLDAQIHLTISQPQYSTNLDHSILLVPFGWTWECGVDEHGRRWARSFPMAQIDLPSRAPDAGRVYAATLPLALCLAALREREMMKE